MVMVMVMSMEVKKRGVGGRSTERKMMTPGTTGDDRAKRLMSCSDFN